MISFRCPRCQCQLTRADNEGGWKTSCPSCGQRLQIPQVSKSKDQTLLGELQGPGESRTMMGELSVQPAPSALPAAIPVSAPSPADPWSFEEPTDTPKRRKHQQASVVPTVLGVVALFFALSFIVLGAIWIVALGGMTPAERADVDLPTRVAVWGYAWFASIGFSVLSTLISLTVAVSMKHRSGLVMSLIAGGLLLLTCLIGVVGMATAPSAPPSVPSRYADWPD